MSGGAPGGGSERISGGPALPPRVEYEITELGASLGPIFAHLATWADTRLGEVERARRAYDAGR